MKIEFNADGSIKLPERMREEKEEKVECNKRKDRSDIQFKNEYFREALFEKFDHKCSVCKLKDSDVNRNVRGKQSVSNLRVHHLNPEWNCWYDVRNMDVDCENCAIVHRKEFDKCLNNCVLVCSNCHKKLDEQREDNG